MAVPVKTAMPDNVDIGTSYTLQIAALDPTTGNAVSGVTIANMAIECVSGSSDAGGGGGGGGGGLAVGPFMLVPGPGA